MTWASSARSKWATNTMICTQPGLMAKGHWHYDMCLAWLEAKGPLTWASMAWTVVEAKWSLTLWYTPSMTSCQRANDTMSQASPAPGLAGSQKSISTMTRDGPVPGLVWKQKGPLALWTRPVLLLSAWSHWAYGHYDEDQFCTQHGLGWAH